MFRREISAKTFAIEATDHAETRRLGEIEWIADGHDRGGNLELPGISDWQSRSGEIDFEQRNAATQISHQLACRIFFPFELDFDVIRFAANSVGGVKRAHWIDEETGPGKFAVLVGRFNFDDCF